MLGQEREHRRVEGIRVVPVHRVGRVRDHDRGRNRWVAGPRGGEAWGMALGPTLARECQDREAELGDVRAGDVAALAAVDTGAEIVEQDLLLERRALRSGAGPVQAVGEFLAGLLL